MSVIIETILFCDDCAEQCGGDDRSQNAKAIRAARKEDGWIQRGSKDYCPKCAPEYQRKTKSRNSRPQVSAP